MAATVCRVRKLPAVIVRTRPPTIAAQLTALGRTEVPSNAPSSPDTVTLRAILTRVMLAIAAKLGSTAGYAGLWLLATGLNNLRGRFAGYALSRPGISFPSYSEDDYVHATEAFTVELIHRPGTVTGRLIHRLLRALRDPAEGYGAMVSIHGWGWAAGPREYRRG